MSEPPEEIELAAAPLAMAICQIRFPTVASIARQDFIGPFQEVLRSNYPVLRAERGVGVTITADGVSAEPTAGVIWRLADPSDHWQVSLAPDFIALQARKYTSRGDFVGRLDQALSALESLSPPAIVDRVGLRYVNHFAGDFGEDDLRRTFRDELLAALGILAGAEGCELLHSLHDTLVAVGEPRVRIRWGRVPAGTTLDPSIEPPATSYWLLDLDMFRQGKIPYERQTLTSDVHQFARRLYTVFRWAVRDEFITSRASQ